MPAIMELLKDGQPHTNKEMVEACAEAFHLSEEDRQTLMENGRQLLLGNRVAWARFYLKKAGLIENVKRAEVKITDTGVKSIAQGTEKITLDALKQYPQFQEFLKPEEESASKGTEVEPPEATPEDMVATGMRQLNDALEDQILDELTSIHPRNFEHLVIQLLLKMGYGEFKDNQGAVTPYSHDGGIDGVIKEDKLGLDTIYVQAKRWHKSASVSRPDVQSFIGALANHNGKKGIFITTGKFSKDAIECAHAINNGIRVILIDGHRLANLMVEYNLGVSIVETYQVKKLDLDFFEEE